MSTAVLIVNFRGYDDLERCLDSLGAQLGPADEVVVVDYLSDAAKVANLLARHPRVVMVQHHKNLGFAAGVNLAAKQTRAPFLCFLNPDAVVEGPLFSVIEDWLQTHPDVDVVGPRVLNGDGTIQPSARKFPGLSTILGGRNTWLTRRFPNNWWSRSNLLGMHAAGPVDVDWLSGSCLVTRRQVFERLGGLDEQFFLYWEDADYCKRVAAIGGRRTYLPLVTVRHFGAGSVRYNLNRAIRAFHQSAYQFYWKHATAAGRLAAPLVRIGLFVRGEIHLRHLTRKFAAEPDAAHRPFPSAAAASPELWSSERYADKAEA